MEQVAYPVRDALTSCGNVITERLVQFSLKLRDVSRWAPAWSQSPLEPLGSGGNKIGLLHLCGGPVEYHNWEFPAKLRIRMYEEAMKSKKLAEDCNAQPGSGRSSLSGKGKWRGKGKGRGAQPRKELPMRGQPIPWKKTKKMHSEGRGDQFEFIVAP